MTVSRLVPIAVIVSCLVSVAPGQSPSRLASPAQSDVPVALSELAEKFCAQIARKDTDALVALWSSTSPGLADFRQQMQQFFSAYDRIEIKSVSLSNIVIDDGRASGRLKFEIEASDARTGKPASGLGLQVEALGFIKEGTAFKILSYGPAAAQLAANLIAANTDRERTSLLEADKELVTLELRRQLIARGNRFKLIGDYARAISAYNIAQSIAERIGDKEGVGWAVADIGAVYLAKAEYATAMDYLARSLKLQETIGDRQGVLFSLKYIGDVHRYLAHPKEALEAYQQCLVLAEGTGNRTGAAYVLDGIGGVYATQGDFQQAREYYRKSLDIQEALGNKAAIAAALASMGYVSGASGDHDGARDYLQKALSLSESIGDKAGTAYAMINLGAVYAGQGDYARAVEYYQRSLTINESLGNKSGIATGLNNIGIIYRMQGNDAQALEYLDRSLKLNQALGSGPGTARVLNSVGNVRWDMREYTVAIDHFNKSLALYEEAGDKAGIATELDNIGSALAGLGEYTRALEYLNRGLSVAEGAGLKAGMAQSLEHVAFVQREQGNYSDALQLADRSLALATELGRLDTVLAARITAGRIYLGMQQPAQARKAFNDAISIIEDLRSRVAGAEQEQERFFEGQLYPYQAMVELLIAQGDIAGALSYAERGKGRVLLDVLNSGRVNINKAMTPEEQEHERHLTADLVSLNTQVYNEQQRPQPDTGRIAGLNARVQKARLDHEAFQTTLYALHPELKVKRAETSPIKLEEAAALASDGRTALLEYVVTPQKTYVFALTGSPHAGSDPVNLTVHTIDVNQKDLAQRVEQFRQTLADQNYGFQKAALDLYRLLLGPVQTQLAGQSSVVIVPDTVLWTLPFQALQHTEGHFVIEDFAISYAPSLTVLRQMGLVRKKAEIPPPAMLLAVGNPLLGNRPLSRAKSAMVDQQFDPLPEAERQARVLGQLYGPEQSKVYVGTAAREDVVKAESSKYKILQLATHGVLNDTSPMYSYVLLSRAEDSTTEDGFLEAWEIMNLNLNAELVVLSACETARGRVGAGEGVIGLSWAVFVAGCPTSVVSQWKVESSSTTELMLDFHRNLTAAGGRAEGGRRTGVDDSTSRLSKAEALRRAQLSLLHSKNYSHPFYWAAFVLVGDGSRPIPR